MLNYFVGSFICDVAFVEVNTCTIKLCLCQFWPNSFGIEQQEYYVNFMLIV